MGLEENFGIFFTVASGYFFIKHDQKKYFINEKINLLALAAASSLCVYFDQKLILIPLICYLSFIFSNKSNKSKMILTIYYLFLSLPFLYLISIWGNITPSSDAEERKILKNFNFHHLGYVLTIVSFYFSLFYYFLITLKAKLKKYLTKKI